MNPFSLMLAVATRDLRIAFRRWGDVVSSLSFFIIVTSLFPLALSPKKEMLQGIGPGVLWIAALLSTLLTLNAMFRLSLWFCLLSLSLMSLSLFSLLPQPLRFLL